jgi:LysR family transcriptional regulator, hydrogen peroxide-inducible genes activator
MAICKSAKADPRADFSATSLETRRLMVQAGLGVTLMPTLAVQDRPPNLHIIPFSEPPPFRSITLYWRPNSVKVKCLTVLGLLISETVRTVFNVSGR